MTNYGIGGQFESDLKTIDVKIDNKVYHLLYLKSEQEKEDGLMNVDSMESDEGALFDYSDDPQDSISFWMKDTTIPLKILFINEDGDVISVHDGEPLSEDYITEDSEPVAWVIELNQSENIANNAHTDLAKDENPDVKVNKLYVYGSDGKIQGEIESGSRIFSRKSTKIILKRAKKAYYSNLDKDYKALGRYVFNEIKAQDNRKPEYIEN